VSDSASTDSEVASVYAMFWRFVHMSVHRYGGNPTGELLTVMTIALLDRAGYNPTASDLAEITGLQKTTVSRYVSRQIKAGFLTETVDSQDRRRRHLCPTENGRKEGEWHQNQTWELARLSSEGPECSGNSEDTVSDLKKILLDMDGSSANTA
jgi:DNA-binding MarR family transcriptional regulator